jgi:hypothetical protein
VDSSHSHNFRELIKIAGLEDAHTEKVNEDAEYQRNWQVVQSWSERSRYRRNQADAARELLVAIKDRRHGVISWIKRQW